MSPSTYSRVYLLLILLLLSLTDGVYSNQTRLYTFEEAKMCQQTYGFLPCSTAVLGNLFLISVYGYIMFIATTYLSAGNELLLEILGPGFVGGFFLPMIGALPDPMLILVSGLSGSTGTAHDQVSVGMGLLAGSTVTLLTVVWGSCVVAAKCDIGETDSLAINRQDTKGFSLTGSGVSTDVWTCYAGRIMIISIIPFFVVQLPQLFNSTGRNSAILIALIISLAILIAYGLYQIFQPWIQRRRLAYAKHKLIISGILKHFSQSGLGKLLNDDGQPNIEVMEKLFNALDSSKSGALSTKELNALILGIRFEEIDFNKEDAAEKLLLDFDKSLDNKVSLDEFMDAVSSWAAEANRFKVLGPRSSFRLAIDRFHLHTKRQFILLGPEETATDRIRDEDDEAPKETKLDQSVDEDVESPKWVKAKAVLMLLLGITVAAAVANPLVDAVDSFSDAASISSFFLSFVTLPLATNSGGAISAVTFARKKSLRTTSLTLSELYGVVTMNNLLSVSAFLGVVYAKGLTWDFSEEFLVIFIVCAVVGAFASHRSTYPLWTSLVAYLLYPFSLALIYVLRKVL